MSRDSHGSVTRAHNVTGEFWGGLPEGRTYSPPREGGERAGLVTLRARYIVTAANVRGKGDELRQKIPAQPVNPCISLLHRAGTSSKGRRAQGGVIEIATGYCRFTVYIVYTL